MPLLLQCCTDRMDAWLISCCHVFICHFFLSLWTFFCHTQLNVSFFCCVVVSNTLILFLTLLLARKGQVPTYFWWMFSYNLCILLCTCFLLLLLLNFHFYFLFYFKKNSLHNISLFFLLAQNQYLPSFNLLPTLLGFFLRHFFSFNTKFFLWILFHLSYLTYLCIITKVIFFKLS